MSKVPEARRSGTLRGATEPPAAPSVSLCRGRCQMQEFRHCGAETTKLAHREALSFGNQGSVSPEWDQRVWCRAAAERAQWGQVEFALIRRVSVPGGGEAGGRGRLCNLCSACSLGFLRPLLSP